MLRDHLPITMARRFMSRLKQRINRNKQPALAITLLEPNSIYASHGMVFLRSITDGREVEYEFKVNRPEFLSILDGQVTQIIRKQLAYLGYKLDHLVSYHIPGWQ
ncbi:hypothetical protein AWB81_04225 [Caballeronia arationis]|uniref:hypothetical protein n=1 Tax=Caballeronia arationis TaxID=1777142 RepID=UPI00074B8496|nr:hypothetical protein [Caballeronia arationis]SAK83624.1 hypothetical protein AWB81_04225 [Caballeronia arationis]